MSLINDALKRTKDAQQQNPPPPPTDGPELKLATPAELKTASNARTLLYLMVGCVIIGNALLFFAIKDRGAKKPTPAAGPAESSAAVATPPPTTPTPAVAPPAPVTLPTPAPPQPAPVAASVTAHTNSVPETPVATVQPEPAKPAPLKLQSIIYNASRSSAMVSGKFVFVGDKVQGFRVTAIDQETVTLVGNGQTNVLSLP